MIAKARTAYRVRLTRMPLMVGENVLGDMYPIASPELVG